jgi:LemA protein
MIVIVFLLVIALLIGLAAVAMYNGLVATRRDCDNALGQIDVQLKRRYDLIPNLVESVKSYMKFEQATLEKVVSARNQALGAKSVSDKAAAEGAVTTALGGFFAVAEAYPELKASENMLNLQEELKESEDKIAYARQYYNEAVTRFNTKIEQFPGSILAGVGGFKTKEIFLLDEPEAREVVKVKFD